MLTNSEQAGFAVRRVDRTIGRSIASTAIFIVFLQAIPHAFAQASIIEPAALWIGVASVAVLQLGQLIFAWLGRNLVPFYVALYLIVVILIINWPFSLHAPMAQGNMPWIWWLLAIGGMNAFGAFKPLWAFAASIFLNGLWLFMSQTASFGPRPLATALQDTLLAFFFATLLGMLLIALRQQTAKTDLQLNRKALLAAETASAKAVELERARVNAIVHDSVLTALLLGANASDDAGRKTAAASARQAIERLTGEGLQPSDGEVSATALFESLIHVTREISDDLKVSTEQLAELVIPSAVASALTEATIQAVTNSVRHAGTVRNRELRLSATDQRVKVVVKDDGRGFRESRVSRSRLGLRFSIRGRVNDVGGKVAIQSAPGLGCTVAMTWTTQIDCAEDGAK